MGALEKELLRGELAALAAPAVPFGFALGHAPAYFIPAGEARLELVVTATASEHPPSRLGVLASLWPARSGLLG